jgi:4-alpha-glucanotransferase
MATDSRAMPIPPFPPGYRASGILMHVTSLPSRYGIGDMGPAAFTWIDRLADAGQKWWQVLPLGPTGFGNSPYQSPSSFAGNTLLVSPERLVEDGLIRAEDCAGVSFPAGKIDFDAVTRFKERLFDLAWANFRAGARPDLQPAFDKFRKDHAFWLDDFALFMALKAKYNGAAYQDWPQELVRRNPAALAAGRQELAEALDSVRFRQFLAGRQWRTLREYAHGRGLRLLGDLPIFVAPDSADVWAHPEFFLLDANGRPRVVAGVPPDYFSPQGQLWGNPLYDWEALRRTGYRWWVARLKAVLSYLDAVRLDHFRAFEAAWHIPAGASTAEHGQWVPGPGPDFFHSVRTALGRLPLLAEDLGMITDEVRALRDRVQLPGMRVLHFAFDGSPDNPFLPQNYVANAVVYTGTHDNDTTRGWYATLPEDARRRVWKLAGRPSIGDERTVAAELVRVAWLSKAALAIAPLQDVLNLGSEARMNVPGRAEGNWRWRCTEEMLAGPVFQQLRELTRKSGR